MDTRHCVEVIFLWQVGVVSDYDLLALDSISGNGQIMKLVLVNFFRLFLFLFFVLCSIVCFAVYFHLFADVV